MKADQKIFHILDLDRTLLDTSKLAQTVKEIIAEHDAQLSNDITAQIKEHQLHRSSFFIFEYIAKRAGEEKWAMYLEELHKRAPKNQLLLPGAKERIAYAKNRPGWAMGIMTYGSKRDQMIKLKLLGLHHEHLLITDTPKKGAIIASWKQLDGRFKLPIEFGGHVVDVVTLDDDKYIAFEGLPAGALGQWVTRASLGGETELQHLSTNVRIVADLLSSVAYLRSKLQ